MAISDALRNWVLLFHIFADWIILQSIFFSARYQQINYFFTVGFNLHLAKAEYVIPALEDTESMAPVGPLVKAVPVPPAVGCIWHESCLGGSWRGAPRLTGAETSLFPICKDQSASCMPVMDPRFSLIQKRVFYSPITVSHLWIPTAISTTFLLLLISAVPQKHCFLQWRVSVGCGYLVIYSSSAFLRVPLPIWYSKTHGCLLWSQKIISFISSMVFAG